jgi:hypothetical protein
VKEKNYFLVLVAVLATPESMCMIPILLLNAPSVTYAFSAPFPRLPNGRKVLLNVEKHGTLDLKKRKEASYS